MMNMNDNKGSVSIEASLVLPLFLFVMLFFIYVGNVYTVNPGTIACSKAEKNVTLHHKTDRNYHP